MCKIRLCVILIICSTFVTAQEPLSVNIAYPEVQPNSTTMRISGEIESINSAQLAALESGVVYRINVEAGDFVKKGQVLMELDSTLAELELEAAIAQVTSARVNQQETQRLVDEVTELSKRQIVAKTLFDERKAAVASAQSNLARAIANRNVNAEILQRHKLVAPFDGVVASRNVDLGEWVTQQHGAFTLISNNQLRMIISVPQEYLAQLKNNDNLSVLITPDSPGIPSFSSNIERFIPFSATNNRSFAVFLTIPEDSGLLPGMSAQAQLRLADGKDRLMLPKSAIKQHPDGGSSIFVVENNRVKRLIIEYQDIGNEKVVISGIPKNKAYVTSGVEVLRDNMQVTINQKNAG